MFNIWDELAGTEDSVYVYHYTSASALIPILEHNRLWATAAHALNDTSELRNGYAQLKTVVDQLKDGLTTEQTRLASRLLELADFLVSDHEFFIACASTNNDSLNLWRNYATGQGHALVLQNDVSYAPLTRDGALFDMGLEGSARMQINRWTRVVYDEAEQARIARLFVEFELQDSASNLRKYVDPTDEYERRAAWFALRRSIVPLLALFKHPAFAAEEEVRLLFESYGFADTMRPYFRAGGNGVAPYIELTAKGFDKDEWTQEPVGLDKVQPLPVIGILPGPGSEDQSSNKARALKALCQSTGHARAWIFKQSTIPLANWALNGR